jgi:hypothetical protein
VRDDVIRRKVKGRHRQAGAGRSRQGQAGVRAQGQAVDLVHGVLGLADPVVCRTA